MLLLHSHSNFPQQCKALFAVLLFLLFIYLPVGKAQSDDVDPLIRVNRDLYAFNQGFDQVIVKPVSRGYDKVIPEFAKRGLSNFFNNIDDVNVIANDLLQLKMASALEDSCRLIINSTLGIAGVIDVASNFGLYKNHEDFGQTLGVWGFGTGPYLVIPFLGNSTLRDAIGFLPDYLLNPIFWVDEEAYRNTLYALDTIDTRLYYMAAESMISGDEYTFVRNAHLQRREYLVADGEVIDEWDDF
jgi:phospholipid-binding lipoprotein MlaA